MAGFPTRDSATCDGAGRRAWEDMRRGASVGRFPRERASARAQAPGTVPAAGSSRYRPRPPGPGVGGPAWRLERCLHEVSMFRMLLSLCSSRFLHEVSPLAPDGHAPQVRARGRVHETRLRTRVCLCVCMPYTARPSVWRTQWQAKARTVRTPHSTTPTKRPGSA